MTLEINKLYRHKRSKDLYRVINFVGNSSVRVQFVGGSKLRTVKIDSLIASKQ